MGWKGRRGGAGRRAGGVLRALASGWRARGGAVAAPPPSLPPCPTHPPPSPRTILAAAAADLPSGVSRTVYLLDDGRDRAKREWVQGLGPGFVYVSGRKRPAGEMNGGWRGGWVGVLGRARGAACRAPRSAGHVPLAPPPPPPRPPPHISHTPILSAGKSGNINNVCRQLYPDGVKARRAEGGAGGGARRHCSPFPLV